MNTNIMITFGDAKFEVSNDASFVESICSALPEVGADDLIVALAGHSSTQVRCALARRDALPIKALLTLAESGNLTVRRSLVYSDAFRAWANTDLLIAWSQIDEKFARLVAEDVSAFDVAETEALFRALAVHDDPDVRKALAEDWNLPIKLLKQLLDDADSGVRWAAEKILAAI